MILEEQDFQNLAKIIQETTSLVKLDLSETIIDDESAGIFSASLSINCSILSVDLSKNELSSSAGRKLLNSLHTNKTITCLDLSHNYLGDKGISRAEKALFSNTTLTSLNLENNGITFIGFSHVVQVLTFNTNLKYLNFANNLISDEGASMIAEIIILNDLCHLKSLNLKSNRIQLDGIKDLCMALERNESITELQVSADFVPESLFKQLNSHLQQNKLILKKKALMMWLRNQKGCVLSFVPKRLLIYLLEFVSK